MLKWLKSKVTQLFFWLVKSFSSTPKATFEAPTESSAKQSAIAQDHAQQQEQTPPAEEPEKENTPVPPAPQTQGPTPEQLEQLKALMKAQKGSAVERTTANVNNSGRVVG